jgi:hypothetical protein
LSRNGGAGKRGERGGDAAQGDGAEDANGTNDVAARVPRDRGRDDRAEDEVRDRQPRGYRPTRPSTGLLALAYSLRGMRPDR